MNAYRKLITAGVTNPFDDPQSNTWSPQDSDLLVEPTDSTAALVARIEALENP